MQMQKTYIDLYKDILNKKDVTRVLSDGYDLVQECALCLCEHYGKHLNDIIGYTKKGNKITVQMACIRKMNKLINRKSRDRYRNISLEALTRKNEPTVEMKEEVNGGSTTVGRSGATASATTAKIIPSPSAIKRRTIWLPQRTASP